MNLPINIKGQRERNFILRVNADRFERLAAGFGFFSEAFVKSLAKAESDHKSGRVKKLKSLKDLR